MKVICTDWRKCERYTLRGFADFLIPTIELHVRDCAVHENNGKHWVQLPARPQPNAEAGAAEIQQRVDDELSGTVIGHLAPTVGMNNWDVSRLQDILTVRVNAKREHRRVFEKPQFVS